MPEEAPPPQVTIPYGSFLEGFQCSAQSPEEIIISNIREWNETCTQEEHSAQIAENLDPQFLFPWELVHNVYQGRTKFYAAFRQFFQNKGGFIFSPNTDATILEHGLNANHNLLLLARDFYRVAGLQGWSDFTQELVNGHLFRAYNMRVHAQNKEAQDSSATASPQVRSSEPPVVHYQNGQQSENSKKEARRRQASAMTSCHGLKPLQGLETLLYGKVGRII